MSRVVNKPVTLCGLAGVLLIVPIWWRFTPAPTPAPLAPPLQAANLEVNAMRAGLDARALAAAGVSAESTTSVISSANQYLLAHPSDLPAADAAYATARSESDRLQRLIQSGQATPEDVTAYQTQSAALATATSQRQAALDAIFNAATEGLTSPQRTALSTLRANRALSEASLEFLAVERSQSEWLQLRECLANERIAVELSDTLDQEMQAQLATWRAVSAVATAKSNLDTNLSSVISAWNAAVD